ncbi:MAG: hypothetical protein HY564_03430 [Candidatus Jacksonbacteria bacterium]|nr:hypothetical protein [Candidatus Jacksonbacteria bacterium]
MTKTAFSDSIIYSSIRAYRITPEQFGIKRVHFSKIKGGDAAYNATVIRGILDGTITDSRRDIILLNAAAGLYIYGLARSLANGMKLARKTIDEKHARQKLEEYIALSHSV